MILIKDKRAKKITKIEPCTLKHKVVKRAAGFQRHHSERYKRVKESWRKPRGIDNRCRRGYRGSRPLVRIGYGTDKRTRGVLPCGMRKFSVSCVSSFYYRTDKNHYQVDDLEKIMMHNLALAAEIRRGVSFKKRKAIIERADQLKIHVLNRNARAFIAEI